jgi:hypothetical protein
VRVKLRLKVKAKADVRNLLPFHPQGKAQPIILQVPWLLLSLVKRMAMMMSRL